MGDNPEKLMYVGRNIPELSKSGLPDSLDEIDTRLAILRAKYTDQDESVRRILDRRRLLVDVFKRKTYGYLYAQLTAENARLKATERPKGVLIKYRELLRTAARNEATLTKLESERQVLALEKARKQDPWELISTPMLVDFPVAPNKKRIVALGLLSGLVLGCGAALIKDRRSDLIYDEQELRKLLPYPLLRRLPAINQDNCKDAAELLASGPLSINVAGNSVALIPLGNLPNKKLEVFSNELRCALHKRELVITTDLRETSRCDTQLLITAPGIATRGQVLQFCEKLTLQGAPLAGWVLLCSN